MSLSEDERWRAVPPSQVLPWLLTIRNTDGSFRTPTKDEVDHLIACYSRAAELEAALEEALSSWTAVLGEEPRLSKASIQHDLDRIAELAGLIK